MQLEILANAESATKASREMLETLLDFSRIEANVICTNPVDFALQPMLYRVFNEFGAQADHRNLVLRLHDTCLWSYADPLLTELIVRNLLSNALRYTDHGGILLAARQRRQEQEVVIEVWDTGIGIAAQNQQEIFREFHQLGNPERDQRKGLGLGMAIVAGLCRAMKIRISLKSQPGRGSVFRLHLPLSSPQQTMARQPNPFPEQRYTINWPDKLRGRRILVIDDNQSVQNAVRFLLSQQGCECRTAESIQAALPLLHGWKPDILVVDYRLQNHQTGGDAIRILRLQLGDDIPAIIITGDTAPERLREAYDLSATLLHKPLTGEILF
jgi:CheY-like chemotaxis protein